MDLGDPKIEASPRSEIRVLIELSLPVLYHPPLLRIRIIFSLFSHQFCVILHPHRGFSHTRPDTTPPFDCLATMMHSFCAYDFKTDKATKIHATTEVRKSVSLGDVRVNPSPRVLCCVSFTRCETDAVSVCQQLLSCSSSSQPRQRQAVEVVQGAVPSCFDRFDYLIHSLALASVTSASKKKKKEQGRKEERRSSVTYKAESGIYEGLFGRFRRSP